MSTTILWVILLQVWVKKLCKYAKFCPAPTPNCDFDKCVCLVSDYYPDGLVNNYFGIKSEIDKVVEKLFIKSGLINDKSR